MGKHSNISLLIVAAGSFIGGVGLGVFIATDQGKKTRQWVSSHASDFSKWIDDKKNVTLQKSSDQLHKIQSRMEKSYKNTIPDLYNATEHIDFNSSN